jgi:DivIVA domain-containing protein
MELEDIGGLRVQGFTVTRRGYDRREVDRFLDALIEWIETDAAKDLGDRAVQRKLEAVGKSTAHILLTTEKESEELRSHMEEECAELRSEAERTSLAVRRNADDYATKTRAKAEEDASRTGEAAVAKAKRIIEEAERRRAQIEANIADLDTRRDGTLRELDRLRGELASILAEHKSAARPLGRDEGSTGERADTRAAGAVVKRG